MYYRLIAILQIGLAYALGILFALGIAGGTSGGHFNPAVTVVHVIFRGFPIPKAMRQGVIFLISQVTC
jgi:glycerol uptake facilitator-like aquaporin